MAFADTSEPSVVNIPLGARSYDVVVGTGVLDAIDDYLPASKTQRALVVADEVLTATGERLRERLHDAGWTAEVLPVTASESLKSREGLDRLYDHFVAHRVDRGTTIFALGGGTVGDAAGYAAATWMRGVPWIGVPTTLLAQVDSSIGGKTGINHRTAKNAIGAIYQPALVVCDIALLDTLDVRDQISGLGEIVKYGLIDDAELYRGSVDRTLSTHEIVTRCAAIKARYIAADEHDVTGIRAVLNFGHTVGHAIEQSNGYGTFRHGEAVALGMRAAIAISVDRGHLDASTGTAIDRDLRTIPTPPLTLRPDELLAALRMDKKRSASGGVRFVLLRSIGETLLDDGVDEPTILRSLDALAA